MAASTTRQVYRRDEETSPKTLKLIQEEIDLEEPTGVLNFVYAVSLRHRDANIILNGTNPWPISSPGIPCSVAAGEAIVKLTSKRGINVGSGLELQQLCTVVDMTR